jgi:hypothetical protein
VSCVENTNGKIAQTSTTLLVICAECFVQQRKVFGNAMSERVCVCVRERERERQTDREREFRERNVAAKSMRERERELSGEVEEGSS